MTTKQKRLKQVHGNSKGAKVKVIKDEGAQLLVEALKSRFKYHVSKLDVEKYYEEIKLKKKSKKKKGGKGSENS